MQKIATVCVLVSLLAGCAGAGNQCLRHETQSTVGKKIVEGVSTKADVQAIFGAPCSVSFSGEGGSEVWHYAFENLSADAVSYIPFVGLFAGSASGTKKTLSVLFDNCGVVKRYVLAEAKTAVKTGLLNL